MPGNPDPGFKLPRPRWNMRGQGIPPWTFPGFTTSGGAVPDSHKDLDMSITRMIGEYVGDRHTRWFLLTMGLLLGAALAALGGCGMVRGIAQDIDSAAQGVARAASE